MCKIECLEAKSCTQMRLFCNGPDICVVECNNTNTTANYDCPNIIIITIPTIAPTILPPSFTSTAVVTTTTKQQFVAINLTLNAQFSDDYRKIIVSFDIVGIETNYSGWENDHESKFTILTSNITECDKLLSSATIQLLSQYAECHWVNHQNTDNNISLQLTQSHFDEYNQSGIVHIDPDEFSIVITLSGFSDIMTNDSLFLNADVFENINYKSSDIVFDYVDDEFFTNTSILNPTINNSYFRIDTQTANNSIIPLIVVTDFPMAIGQCQDLILDARNSYNLGMFCQYW